MSIPKEFMEAVDSKNLTLVRVMLKDSLVLDPTFKDFDNYISYATKNLNTLYEEHNNKNFELNESSWTKDYMNKQLNKLMYNFSKERINHLKKVCAYIYKDRVINISNNRNSKENTNNYKKKKRNISTTTIFIGAVTTATGIVIKRTILTASGFFIVAAGVAMKILSDKDNKNNKR